MSQDPQRSISGDISPGEDLPRLRRTFLLLFAGFASTVILLALLAIVSMEILAGVRSYVGAESLWTKAQKQAVVELLEYSRAPSDVTWEDYREATEVLEGYRQAREALQAEPPRRDAAREGFLQGGVHPHDVPPMIRLFRIFPHIPRGREAIDIWTIGDSLVNELRLTARELRSAADAPFPEAAGLDEAVARVDTLNEVLTEYERAFSRTLAGAAHSFRSWVYRGIGVLSLLILGVGGGAAYYTFDRLRRRDLAMKRSERRYRRIFRDSQDAIYVTRRDGSIEEMNRAGIRLLGYSQEELRELDAAELYADPTERERFHREIQDKGHVRDFEVRLETKEGEILDCLLTSTARWEGGEVVGYQGIIRNVTERKEFQRQLEHQALHDPLTGLPNRALFWDRAEQALARVTRRGGKAAILFVDLDRFKSINDSLGHAAGDRTLEEVAERLQSAVRDPDTVARLGGDEFGILLEDITGVSDSHEVADRIGERLAVPLRLQDQEIHLSASIGIAMIPDDSSADQVEEPDLYVRRADTAMYRAKEEPGTGHRTFDAALDTEQAARVQRESEMRRALERGEFVLHFQPIEALAPRRIRAVEPLLRWNHPGRGLLPPAEFLGLASETGLIRDLGRWVLAEATRRVAAWNGSLPPDRGIRLQPNVSTVELADPGYVTRLQEILEDSGFPPEQVMLEVTEHTAMKSGSRIEDIRETGLQVAVDDFGTGYSSLAYVKQLQADALKVDRSFVEGLPSQATDRAIVETIVTLAHSLDMEVIAEGVENQEQLDWLHSVECDSAQGYLLGRPVPAEEIEEALQI